MDRRHLRSRWYDSSRGRRRSLEALPTVPRADRRVGDALSPLRLRLPPTTEGPLLDAAQLLSSGSGWPADWSAAPLVRFNPSPASRTGVTRAVGGRPSRSP